MASYKANYLHRGKWWVAWTDDVPGAVTQGRALASARENLKDAIALMLEPADDSEPWTRNASMRWLTRWVHAPL